MDYKETVHLPKTDFPMRANLPNREPGILATWAEMNLNKRLREAASGREKFILHDGPPYANGHLHMGHAINKVLKDVIVKAKQMQGFDANYVPGWDCHGLPIELKAEQALKKKGQKKEEISPVEFRRHCRDYADKWVDVQREEFKRLGVVGDWENPYLTMNYRFEADTVRELGKFIDNGSLFRGFKPVYWCANDVTALAEAEVEYEEHESQTIHVKFPLADGESLGDVDAALDGQSVSVVIWTTTPWTIPANLGVALNPGLDYSALKVTDPGDNANLKAGEILILASGLSEQVLKEVGLAEDAVELVAQFPGEKLDRKRFRHPYLDQDAPIVLGDHVTLEAGTGCVHTAPGHGQEDYVVGKLYGLEIFNPVDDRGIFRVGTPVFEGQHVTKANPLVVEHLREVGALIADGKLTHSYPHCWRCHKPVIYRATPQWFISMEIGNLRDNALKQIRKTEWIPNWGEERIYKMVEARPDWCVSRQRSWGVPITVISCAACEDSSITDAGVVEKIAQAVEAGSADVWFEREAADFLPEGAQCPKCGHDKFEKESDILDVWFDSGVTHAAVLKRREDLAWPADLYLEGSDQHRGWFHSSLLASVGANGQAPYKAVLTHGFVVDGKGRKMSKSLGNVMAPEKVIKQYGADILRMWVSAEDYAGDIRISQEILKGLADAYRRIRNTLRYLLSNLGDFDPAGAVPLDEMPELDRYALDRLARLIEKVEASYDTYTFHQVYQELHYFCAMDMGAFYLDIVKDRLYCDADGSISRRSALTVLHHLLETLVRLMAPILSFTAEEVWGSMTGEREDSVHLSTMPKPHPEWKNDDLAARWERFRKVRSEAYRLLEADRKEKRIGSSLQASVALYAGAELKTFMESFDGLDRLFIASRVAVLDSADAPGEALAAQEVEELKIVTAKAEGQKCVRCWNLDPGVGEAADHPELCPRCHDVVAAL